MVSLPTRALVHTHAHTHTHTHTHTLRCGFQGPIMFSKYFRWNDMFICYTDCQDCSMTTNIIWGIEAKITAHSLCVCSDEQMHVHFSWRWPWLGNYGLLKHLCTDSLMAWCWRESWQWAAKSHHQSHPPSPMMAAKMSVVRRLWLWCEMMTATTFSFSLLWRAPWETVAEESFGSRYIELSTA
jgi:hypothetical protein